MAVISTDEAIELTKELLTKVHKGDYSTWFEHLSRNSIWAGTGEDMYFGKKHIIEHFSRLEGNVDSDILNGTYYPVKLSSTTCMIVAKLILGSRTDPDHQAHALYSLIYRQTRAQISLIYRQTRAQISLIYQHTSFEFTNSDTSISDEIPFDLHSSEFIRSLLVNVPVKYRVPITYGTDAFYVDTQTILYLKSNGCNTDIVCIDKVIPCTTTINKLMKILPPTFYHIHRSYAVNTIYITHVERFQANLVSDLTVPIPPRNYMKVKKDLEKIFLENNSSF